MPRQALCSPFDTYTLDSPHCLYQFFLLLSQLLNNLSNETNSDSKATVDAEIIFIF